MIRNSKLGGTDWTYGETPLKSEDLNDTFNAVSNRIFSELEQLKIAVSNTDNYESYSEPMFAHLIKNVGSTTCFINTDNPATTSTIKLNPLEFVYIEGYATEIHAITSSGTTDLRVIGQK